MEQTDYDPEEVLRAGTLPPYVQVGMRVVLPADGAAWWEVEIIEDCGTSGLEARLRSGDMRRITVSPHQVRGLVLAEDFDPVAAVDAMESRALREIDSIDEDEQ